MMGRAYLLAISMQARAQIEPGEISGEEADLPSSEARRREVRQLLKDYRVFWTPFGGARPLDETGVIDAAYGPAGYLYAGMQFTEDQAEMLRESYEVLDEGLRELKSRGDKGMWLWLALHEAYLSDPGDPSKVEHWKANHNPKYGNEREAVWWLGKWTIENDKDLYVVWPKRMPSRQSKHVDQLNDDWIELYRVLRSEGMGKSRAVVKACEITGYEESRGWRILKVREGKPEEVEADGQGQANPQP
jgi:hypothetical protein